MAEPAVVTDHFWQAAATDFRRSPGVPRQTISLGFIGDGPVGLEPGPHEGPWWRPFRREWSSRYYGGAGWGGQPYGVYASGY